MHPKYHWKRRLSRLARSEEERTLTALALSMDEGDNFPELTQNHPMCEAFAEMHERRYFQGQQIPTHHYPPKPDIFQEGLQNLGETLKAAKAGVVTVTDLAEKMERLSREALADPLAEESVRPHQM